MDVAAGESVAASRDVNVSADHGSVAAGVIHGDVNVVQVTQAEAARLPVSLPPRPQALAGREDLLAELHRLLAGDDGPTPRVVVLSGLAGVGKTSLAAEYAHRHLAELGIAWQVAAEDPVLLAASLAELAAQAGGRGVADPRDPVASAHAVLAAFPGQWLVIFDNAPGEDAIHRFLPPAGRGRVLITSQSQHWPGAQVVDVPVLDPQAATGLLMSRAGDPDLRAASELAAELGGLPLALTQAAAYARAAGITLASYLNLFRQRHAELLARSQAPGHSVAATIGLALSRLDTESPTAGGLLRLLAFLAPEPVPLGLLLAGPPTAGLGPDTGVTAAIGPLLGDQIAIADAVAALRGDSLVAPAGDGMVLAHRLVQAVTRDQVPAGQAGAWRQAAVALTEAAIPADPQLPAAWPACTALLPHAQAVLDLTSDGMRRIARYLSYSGSYPAARDLFARIAGAFQRADGYGPDHRQTLIARGNLAVCTGQAGDAAGARDLFAALLPDMDRVLGPDHPETLNTRHELARCTGQTGDAAGARDQLAALLPVRERVLGPDHPDTLTTRHSVASWTGVAGDAAGARDQLAALLPVRERVLGPDHPDTLATRHQLAGYTGAAGDVTRERDLFAALLPDKARVLGPDHPSTLATRNALAVATGVAGDAAGARDQLAALLTDKERVLGPDHPSTLITRRSLEYWASQAGQAD